MTKVIAVNSGSSSLKFQLFDMPSETVLTSGQAERIGQDLGAFTIKVNGEKVKKTLPLPDHKTAVDLLLKSLVEYHIVDSLEEIKGAGHRIVQGGAYFDGSVVVNDDVVEKVDELSELAPLHNPAHLVCYKAFKEALPHIGHVFVFDTAFHTTMGPEAFLFPVPYDWYTQYKIRRYGAHGTSHYYVSRRCAELMGMDINHMNLITCHLGNGASITAIRDGKCINTSMGLTPLGGIMMGTRSGDIDPTVVFYMMKKLNLTPDQMDTILNKRSGMLGVSGISSDARDIQAAVEQGNERAILTTELYTNRVINVVGGYYMELGHTDAMVFTAGLGENDSHTRERILKHLEEGMGLSIDYEKNAQVHGTEALISKPDSKVAVWVIPTNEELVIARDTVRLLGL
ncbi:acetate kinase [Erysipelotrichaceae bacterium Oil+RF-744-GAM-WT-6]|jgi:acetate kinase|uniref:Acetate kinase n=1 Tax=Stecheria intestinalis TaxID=2606630 RepID=A0A7X2NQ30_9FIRM|nr:MULTISPECIES: acetate kinase [Erysipelotrichaceae]MCI2153229.1 acetate kinase [Solobacterium sp.]MDY3234948.1 acetate kinase [Erysipelotrichaceae bacterium]MDY4680631.1 acetate kinase [Lachnospiraceae bacterium]MCI6746428.1 acetate kinase [Anaerolactibacter massiliensis]MDD5880603.1 acetate kinase [Stecheria intestinalis]